MSVAINRPGVSLVVAILGIVIASTAVAILIGAPIVFGTAWSEFGPWILTNYFLAMADRLVRGAFPFYWTPHWIYQVGSLTPLIALGAFLALRAGSVVRRSAPRAALVIVALACFLLIAYVVAGVYAVVTTRSGVPL